MKFYFSGQRTFSNRGCEALVRSSIGLIRQQLPQAKFLVPSSDAHYDAALWPEHAEHGVSFVPSYFPFLGRVWTHAKRLPIPALKRAPFPFAAPAELRRHLSDVDAVLAIGGDNYSLDYRIPVITQAVDNFAMDMGKPVYLWGASVGPFGREPAYKPSITQHLSRMARVFVREQDSFDYLTGKLGLKNVALAADPAFSLQPEAVDMAGFWPSGKGDVIGVNFSPLMARKQFSADNATQTVLRELIERLLAAGKQILLVPHVFQDPGNNDHAFMLREVEAAGLAGRVGVVPPLNACQLKFAISRLSLLIAARTHATIAGFSSQVPTISLSYSVKSIGINKMLFDHADYAIPTQDLTADRIMAAVGRLEQDQASVRRQLAERSEEMRRAGARMAEFVVEDLAGRADGASRKQIG